jgi:hypothetical protein
MAWRAIDRSIANFIRVGCFVVRGPVVSGIGSSAKLNAQRKTSRIIIVESEHVAIGRSAGAKF